MSKLKDLLASLCPNGVEFKPLREIAEMQRGKSLTKATSSEGKYPVISGGREPAFYIDQYNREGETITVAGSGAGAGYVQFWNIPIFVCDAFSVKANTGDSTKYLYYFLQSKQDYIYSMKKGGGVPHVHISDIENLKIPVPPLEVQREIVRILDTFTELTAELQKNLEAELTARKKQYEYYRDMLLTFDIGGYAELKKLGEIAEISRGGNFQKKDFVDRGFPCIHYGQIYTLYRLFVRETANFISSTKAAKQKKATTNDIVMAVTSENVEDVCKCVAWLGEGEIAVSGHTAIIHPSINAKYLVYYFTSSMFYTQKLKLVHGTKVMEVSPNSLSEITIPVPPLAEQERIVKILDQFDALCNDLSEGLPAEIAARQKQYEYYRDKLLTFEELN